MEKSKNMKAHAVIFLSIILFLGCKTRKNVVRSVDAQTRIETVATTLDTSRIVEKSLVGMQAEKTEQDNSYIRSTEFDSSGVIRRIYEEWR
uniref:hypothetical protein n=1 Tax=Neisseria dentiae TaxID=194197 RepID=UPI0035A04742